ncbi:Nitrilase/cyanide hydratase and apolipoprotein N-acyltransferase [Lachnospiraceae bacterium TWA4]|nr:Nitrilase/cyanide hydratase and apolipoprotein N-acyltransferase [Lachnospiraceae bacterium TWA4]
MYPNFIMSIVQMEVSEEKEKNLQKTKRFIKQAALSGASVVVLPEMFCCPYSSTSFPQYAEEQGGLIWQTLSTAAKENHVLLIGGSMPERDGDKIYNTCFCFDENGNQIGRHRKVHLFDIEVKDGQKFKESDTIDAGNDCTVLDTKFGKIGVGICYDMRFPELSRMMVNEDARLLVFPAAFNMTTGPLHWELLLRSRAVDNQCYVIGASSARNYYSDYISYAHSMVASPWGRIIVDGGERECIISMPIIQTEIDEVRKQIPVLAHRRIDLY